MQTTIPNQKIDPIVGYGYPVDIRHPDKDFPGPIPSIIKVNALCALEYKSSENFTRGKSLDKNDRDLKKYGR